jgi:hypothetical protein
MSGPVSLLGKPIPTIERNEGAKLVALLSVAGLIAGLISAGLVYPVGGLYLRHFRNAQYIFGVPLGLTLAFSLAARGLLRGLGGFCKGISLVALSSVAYVVAWWIAAGLGLAFHGSDRPPFNYPVSMFAGGFAGGFLVLGGVFLLVYPSWEWPTIENAREPSQTAAFKVLLSSVLCGILGIVGWDLGPYFGIYFWSVLHDLGLTPTDETFQNALYGEKTCYLSLFVVWQTGTAAALGFVLQSHRPTSARSQIDSRTET